MKLVVIGFGQCGGRLADEFARLGRKARAHRGIEIVTGAFAVNTDAADLTGLSTLKADYQHRILVGGRKTGGHGVGKINELAAELIREDGDKVINAIRTAPRFFETDAFLVIAGAAGGTGSGSISVMTQILKERYLDKPIFAMVVLPFEHEEVTEARTTYNSATCLKSIFSVADAVFLIDNQRYIRKDFSLGNNLAKINTLIVEPFYDLLCAGEEKKARYVGAKTLDAGDIIQTLVGWTVIGYGKSELPLFRFPFRRVLHFRKKSTEIDQGMQAMDEAISELSITCKPMNSGRALYLVAAPAKEMSMTLIKELGNYLKEMSPEAIIRNGDYPRERGSIDVTLVLSELNYVEKVRAYYDRATNFVSSFKTRRDAGESRLKELEEAAKDLPMLM